MSPFASACFSPVRLSEFAPSRCVCSVCPFCIEPFGSFPFCLVFRFVPLCLFGFSRIHIILFRFVPLRSHSCSLIVLDPGGACAEQFSYCACRLDPMQTFVCWSGGLRQHLFFQKALRVSRAVTRLTVYRPRRVLKFDEKIKQTCFFQGLPAFWSCAAAQCSRTSRTEIGFRDHYLPGGFADAGTACPKR